MRMNRAFGRWGWRSGPILLATALFLAPPAAAADLYVDCSPGNPSMSPFTSIRAAINSLAGPPPAVGGWDRILLRSDCVENVTLTRDRVWIAPEWDSCPWNNCTTNGPLARITAVNPGQPVVNITGPHGVTLVHLALSGGSNGLRIGGNASVETFGVVMENNSSDGVSVGSGYVGGGTLNMGEGGSLHNAGWGVRIAGGSSVRMYGRASWLQEKPFFISGNGGGGILLAEGSSLFVSDGVMIENNEGRGLFAAGGDASFGAWRTETVVQGNQGGAFLSHGSEATFWGRAVFRDNGPFGVYLEGGSHVTFSECCTANPNQPVILTTLVEGHTGIGVNATMNSQAFFRGANQVLHNGSPGDPTSAGIRIDGNSHAFFEGGTEVAGNVGPGILVDLNSSLDASAAIVRGNTQEGVRVRHMSVAYLASDSKVRPNAGGPLTCDITSMAITDLVRRSFACLNVGKPTEPRPPTPQAE